SVCNRRKDASTASKIYFSDSPFFPTPISPPTLVARIILSRFPDFLNQFPIIVSDSPPLFPGTQVEYLSAVSIKYHSLSTNASKISNDCFSSIVHLKTFAPKHIGFTFNDAMVL